MKNKKNIIIITLSIILIILFTIIGVIVIAHNIKYNENSYLNNKENLENEEIKDLLYNNYLITYLLEGDVQTGEGVLTIEDENDIYYAVTDELLKDIKTLEDINNLIDITIPEEFMGRIKEYIASEYSNKYVDNGNTLYVKKGTGICSVNNDNPVEKNNVSYRLLKDGRAMVEYGSFTYSAYDHDGIFKAHSLWFNCSPFFDNTLNSEENPEE